MRAESMNEMALKGEKMEYYNYEEPVNCAPPKKYWLYPGVGMPSELFDQCLELLGMTEEEVVKALTESKALVFTLGPAAPPHPDEFEHYCPDSFEIAPAGTRLSKTFEGWNYLEARGVEIVTCELVERRSPPRPFMP